MGRGVQGLRAWRNSQSCFVLFLISNSTRGARWFSVIVVIVGILGLILGIPVLIGLMKGSVASVVSDHYAELVALMAMLAVLMIAYLTASIAGFRGLANALPALVEELRGRAQPEVEVPLCLVEYFGVGLPRCWVGFTRDFS
jgi:ABC-type dipeptide/oligopeptide/nickel transport system permease subunit